MEGIQLQTPLAVLLRADLTGGASTTLNAILAGDLAADVADEPAEP
jgi:hypothetical protein